MASATGDRNLLFGILALQMDFIQRDALVKAMHAWVLDKAKPLGRILLEQGVLTADTHALLDALVRKHLELHGGDAEKSLASVSSLGSAREELKQIADPDVQASLIHLPPAADPYVTEASSVGAPSVVGRRFRILRPHARGGLGEVFVAQDEELHREVALKEIQERHADHPGSRARFLVEAEITGGLEHPGIVPVYGLGQYADGRPFYAMRFIRGDSLKEAIERYHKEDAKHGGTGERSLELRKLLGRFVDVCDAIGYAHSRGVLHRDLKPGNVMLGKYGETLVVDWGLAKPVGGPASKESEAEAPLLPASADDSAPTQMGTAIGTPAFMPPEQAAGRLDLLGPASDVYSLGATLYCLLTGKAPFEGGDVGAVLQRVQRGDFPRPRQVQRDVPPALEAVCLKAMALRPSDRYPTPRALAGDIEKWLADERVSAWREPWRVRLGRWARRNQTLVAAVAAGVLVAILAGGAGALWYQHDRYVRATEAERARQTAETEHAKRAAATERDVTAALEEAATLGEQAAKIRLDDPAKWGAALTLALSAVKRAEGVLNNGEGTDELRDRVAAQREALEAMDKDRRMIAALEAARFQGAAAGRQGGFDIAGEVALYRAAFQQDDKDWDSLAPAEAAARINQRTAIRDDLLAALADWSNITANKQESEKLRGVLQAADHDPTSLRNRWNAALEKKDVEGLRRLALSPQLMDQPTARLVIFAQTLTELGAATEAAKFLKKANEKRPGDFWIAFYLAVACSATKPPATDEAIRYYTAALMSRPNSLVAHNNLGLALLAKGQMDEAMAEYDKALQIRPDDNETQLGLGSALELQRKLDEAIAKYKKAIALKPDDAYRHNDLGQALEEKGQLDEAIVEYKKAIEFKPDYADFHYHLAFALKQKDQVDEAIAEYRKVLQFRPDFAEAHKNLAFALADKGHVDEAIAEFRKVLQFRPGDAYAYNDLAFALKQKGQLDEAITEYRKAVQTLPNDAAFHNNLGIALRAKGRLDEAIAEFRKALQILPDDALAHNNLAVALNAKGQIDEAITEYRKALQIQPDNAVVHTNLGAALADKHQWDEAIMEFRKAIQIQPDYGDVHFNLGIALSDKHQWDEAITEFRKAIQTQPDDADSHNNLGNALSDKHQWDEAIAEFRNALQIQPDDADALYYAACAAALAGSGKGEDPAKIDEKERSRWRKQALDWVRTSLNLSTKKIDDGKPEDCLAAAKDLQRWQLFDLNYKDALAKLPADEQEAWRKVWADMDALLKKSEDGALKAKSDEAIAEYRKAVALKPDDANAHCILGLALYYDKHQWDEAIAEYRKAIQIKPDYAAAHDYLGDALKQKGQLDEAIAEYRKAIQIYPDFADAHNNLGNALKQKGQLSEAITEYVNTLHIRPLDDDTFYHAACTAALAASGKGEDPAKADEKEHSSWRKQALDWLRTALTLWTKKIDAGNPQDRAAAAKQLQHWQADSDLAGVRDKEALAKLPTDEQDAWRKLWADVDALLKKAQQK